MSSQPLLSAPFTRENFDAPSQALFDGLLDSRHALLEAGSLTSSAVNRFQPEKQPLSPDEFLWKLLLQGEKISMRMPHAGFSPDLGSGSRALNPGEMILTNQRLLLMTRTHATQTSMTRGVESTRVFSTLQDIAFFYPLELSACRHIALDFETSVQASASIFSSFCDCCRSTEEWSPNMWKLGPVDQKMAGSKTLSLGFSIPDYEKVNLRVFLLQEVSLHVATDYVAALQRAVKGME